MNLVIAFVVAVLVFQVVLFFVIRARNKKMRQQSVLEKYKIQSAADAFRIMNDPDIPQEDREKIEILYNGGDDQ